MIRIKNTDAKKLQDEYEKLVSGLAQANDTREDEDMMASPGTSPTFVNLSTNDQCYRRICYQESGTFHRFLETIHRVPQGNLIIGGLS
jgi:hypothetical protein